MTYRSFAYPLLRNLVASLAFAFAFAVGLSFSARADVAVIVPPHAESGLGSELIERAVEELSRLFKVQGFDVVSAGQAGAAAEAERERGAFPKRFDPLRCTGPDCANEYRKLFDATFAAQLTLFARGVRPASVSVVLTETEDVFFQGAAPIEGRDVASAVRVAFETARAKQEEGAGPWLTVTGTPQGAIVYLDGVEYGRVPFSKRRLDPGSHRLEGRAERHVTESRVLSVPATIDHVELVTLSLRATAAPELSAAPRPRALERRSAWDWGIGASLAAAGAAHFAAGAYQKAKAGDCAEYAAGRCSEIYGDTRGVARENLLLGIGAAGIALGATVAALGPIGWLQLRAGVDRAQLQLRGDF